MIYIGGRKALQSFLFFIQNIQFLFFDFNIFLFHEKSFGDIFKNMILKISQVSQRFPSCFLVENQKNYTTNYLSHTEVLKNLSDVRTCDTLYLIPLTRLYLMHGISGFSSLTTAGTYPLCLISD